jgi:hypothetical protein
MSLKKKLTFQKKMKKIDFSKKIDFPKRTTYLKFDFLKNSTFHEKINMLKN